MSLRSEETRRKAKRRALSTATKEQGRTRGEEGDHTPMIHLNQQDEKKKGRSQPQYARLGPEESARPDFIRGKERSPLPGGGMFVPALWAEWGRG